MRVLMVLGHATGGVGAHVDTLVTGLRRLGHDVQVVTADSTARAFGWADAHRLWPVHAGARAPRGLVDWHRVMRLAGTVDVVHAHGHQAAVVAAVAVARARPRPRLVVSLHNDLPPTPSSPAARGQAAVSRRLLGWCLRRADLVTGASSDLVDLAVSLGARRAELALVPSAAVPRLLRADRLAPDERESLLAGAGLPTDRPLVLTVSRIAPQKDLPTLVRAARLSRVPATWAVVGDGDERLRAHLEHEADGIRPLEGGGPVVRFVGARSDVQNWLRAADVFVLTSRWEARALVVQEAMAAGLPVVVTRSGGLPGLVGDAGSLVAVGDPSAVASEVDRLLGDPDARARTGAAARAVAARWPTVDDETRRWVDRYATDALGMT
ncbi:glycosyltransferase family 4 protein [Terrabacter sp. C0L_2]|uniref:glycosyltransferase family 4 protein n=1 Tax=Terrabacter sp. C0L_2 TaxID=3108389 RepID=UPI002ED2E99C|nr:glycosyltransferase family 4 protein [Terrabacter sp. C0L_2]